MLGDDTYEPSGRDAAADLKLVEQALRNDWPIPQRVKTRMLQIAINIIDPPEPYPDPEPPPEPAPDDAEAEPAEPRVESPKISLRTKLTALRVVALFSKLSLEQQRLDLLRDRLQGNAKGFVLADAVTDAIEAEATYVRDVKPT